MEFIGTTYDIPDNCSYHISIALKLLFLIPDRLPSHDPYIDGAKGILVEIPFQTMIRERFVTDPDPFFRDGIVYSLDGSEIEIILTLEWLIQPEVYHFCTHTLLQISTKKPKNQPFSCSSNPSTSCLMGFFGSFFGSTRGSQMATLIPFLTSLGR